MKTITLIFSIFIILVSATVVLAQDDEEYAYDQEYGNYPMMDEYDYSADFEQIPGYGLGYNSPYGQMGPQYMAGFGMGYNSLYGQMGPQYMAGFGMGYNSPYGQMGPQNMASYGMTGYATGAEGLNIRPVGIHPMLNYNSAYEPVDILISTRAEALAIAEDELNVTIYIQNIYFMGRWWVVQYTDVDGTIKSAMVDAFTGEYSEDFGYMEYNRSDTSRTNVTAQEFPIRPRPEYYERGYGGYDMRPEMMYGY